jgi:hypothetical protein
MKFAPKSKASGLSAGMVSLLGQWLGEPYSASDSLTAMLGSARETAGWSLLSAQRLYFPT